MARSRRASGSSSTWMGTRRGRSASSRAAAGTMSACVPHEAAGRASPSRISQAVQPSSPRVRTSMAHVSPSRAAAGASPPSAAGVTRGGGPGAARSRSWPRLRSHGCAGPTSAAASAMKASDPPARLAPRSGQSRPASHSLPKYASTPAAASTRTSTPERSATRKSKIRCTTAAHAKEAGTSRVRATAQRSPGSSTSGNRFRTTMSPASGPTPSAVPASTTRRRRRVSADEARR